MTESRNEEVFICRCFSPEHMIYITYDEDYNDLYLHYHMDRNIGFWNRLKYGIKYIFGYDSKYGQWDCMMIKTEDKERLINIIQKLKPDENTKKDEII